MKVRRAARRFAALAGLLVCAALGLLVLALFGVQAGLVATALGFTIACLPAPVYVALVLWIDRFEAEPPRLLALAFFLGATLSVFTAALLNTFVGDALMAVPGMELLTLASGGAIEELTKGAILVTLFLWRRDEFDGVIDGIVYAGMVGLGFAMMENVQYYGQAALAGGLQGSARLFILRGCMAPFAHPLFTSVTGIALGLALRTRSRALRAIAAIAGLSLAAALHAVWNIAAAYGAATFMSAYLYLMAPLFALGLGIIAVELRREGRCVREQLAPEREAGLITQDEHARLGSVFGRLGESWGALRRGGLPALRASIRRHQIASELAFLRARVAAGLVPDDDEARALAADYVRELSTPAR
ncbi:MAG: PrsW family intramembrane metalloprotease [Myxococcales bacterium]|nr:PrsW family intramembrane metalloprotease [Myxococcales bacterium]